MSNTFRPPPLGRLNATRLLNLHCSLAYSDPLSASLFTVDLTSPECPDYEFFSYTWGDLPPNDCITINDCAVPIRPNLSQGLRRLRQVGRDRVLWVDALSISQMDLEEKSLQVRMIRDIVKKASTVLVWLGEHENYSEMLFMVNDTMSWSQALAALQHDDEGSMSGAQVYVRFLSRPYWNRVWVLQEFLSARKLVICCGQHTRDLETMLPHLQTIEEYYMGDSKTMAAYSRNYNVEHDPTTTKSAFSRAEYSYSDLVSARFEAKMGKVTIKRSIMLMDYVHLARNRQCLDRRDKIYALLSLEGDALTRETIGVDYTCSIPELVVRVLRGLSYRENPDVNRDVTGEIQNTQGILWQSLDLKSYEIEHIIDLILDSTKELNKGLEEALSYFFRKFLHKEAFELLVSQPGDSPLEKERLLKWRLEARTKRYWPQRSMCEGTCSNDCNNAAQLIEYLCS